MDAFFRLDEKVQEIFNLVDHLPLVEQLRQFRMNPKSIIPKLQQRKKNYREIKGKQYLFSNQNKKKAIQINQEEKPQARLNELISILKNMDSLGEIYEVPKLTECASKFSQTLSRQVQQQVHFKPGTSMTLRKILDSDQFVGFPNQVACLISLTFHDGHSASLLNLLVDDDMTDRPNRSILLDPKYKYIGIFSAVPPNKIFMACTVYLLTDKAIAKKKEIELMNMAFGQINPE